MGFQKLNALVLFILLIGPMVHLMDDPLMIPAEGYQKIDDLGPGDFDLYISTPYFVNSGERVVWENISIGLNSRLDIMGSLTLRNCTLVYLGVVPSIRLFGEMIVEDLDDDPSTTDDSSWIYIDNVTTSNMAADIGGGTGFFNASNTRFDNAYISGDMDIHGCYFNSSTVLPLGSSSFSDTLFEGDGEEYFIQDLVVDPLFDNVTVSDYMVGIRSERPEADRSIIGLTIKDCSIGIQYNNGTLLLKDSTLIDNELLSSRNSDLMVVDSTFINGTFDLRKPVTTTFQSCSFIGIESIRNASGGVIRDSLFMDMEIALREPGDLLVVENRFRNNRIAVENALNCTFYHNSFIDNIRVVSGPPLSTWFDDSLKEGNHYDSYTGKDDGSGSRRSNDGIGDTQLPYLGRDEYPLLQDLHWKMPEIPEVELQYEGGTDKVELNWDQSGTNFILQRSTSLDFSTHLTTWSTNQPSIVIYENSNTTLYFRVRGYNSFGSRGWSIPREVFINQRPLPPINLEVVPLPEGGSLLVSWEWQGEDIDRGMILPTREGIDLNPEIVDRSENEHVLRELDNNMEYTIRMISIDRSGLTSELSGSINATPIDLIPPPPPRNIKARTRGNESIALEWDPPLTQDLWGYVVYRRGPGETELKEITRFSKGVLYFEDQGLMDDTTYEYALASVDDDGPISEMSPIVSNTTLHFNHRPVFSGNELILYLIEDEGPLGSNILDDFTDQDGDELTFKVLEFFPFQASISDGKLWVVPEQDQAGEGYIQISVSDGEEVVPYLIGVIVEPVDDAPKDVSIISPLNGSVLLPGAPVTLEGSGYDPDTEQGDILNVSWNSDRDGILHISTQSNLRAIVDLSPGLHKIRLSVEDRTGNRIEDEITVMVSLWGWGESPWKAEFDPEQETVDPDEPYIGLVLTNDSPLVLRFSIKGVEGQDDITERSILVGPSSEGSIRIQVPFGLKEGEDISLTMIVETQTLNGTYGGSQEISISYSVKSPGGSNDGSGVLIAVILIFSIGALIMVGIYLFVTYVRKEREGPQM